VEKLFDQPLKRHDEINRQSINRYFFEKKRKPKKRWSKGRWLTVVSGWWTDWNIATSSSSMLSSASLNVESCGAADGGTGDTVCCSVFAQREKLKKQKQKNASNRQKKSQNGTEDLI
jgi:hypothetical protein